MSVKFLTDSACDIVPEEAEALGVEFVPIQISFADGAYEDAVTITHKEFYEKLAKSEALPTTSQINPSTYDEYFRRLTAGGDELVVITLSSGLSGTYQSAVLAAADYADRVFVVDSLNATSGQYILVKRGLELAARGLSAAEIATILDEEKMRVRVIALIDTLEYLKKGGRISSTVAFAGSLLGIKPAIEVKEGKIEMAGTARGLKKGQQLVRELMDKYNGIDQDKPMAYIYSGSDELLRQFIASNSELWEGLGDIPSRSLGGTIGTHIGPGACGVAFFEK